MNSETDVGIKFTASVNGNNKLEKLAASLSSIKAVADGLNGTAINSINESASSTKEIAKQTSTMANTVKLAFNYSTVRMFARTLGNVTRELTRLANKSSEYLENINLFQVAFDGNYRSAEKFINKITEMYGLDESRITRVVGIFKQLSNAMNVSAETGERLATLMTQMSLDISSLYNVDFERSVSVLQSAISGQTKPIRGTTGADITQSTLQTTLDSLGIDKMVNQLTFAEKRLLIIISLTQQLQEATNDLGRTIESPANQLKVLSEQWQRLSRALGNTFLPILSKILPYLNAIMMVLTEIINMIAKLFGYKKEDYDYFSGTADAVMDLEDSLGKATAGAGKLKKALSGLRGFDKLNVISTPASGGAGGGSGVGGTGIDGDILKAFNDAYDSYNKKLDSVKMKASKIRDSIMEWLGFTKEIDPLTGEIVWKYQGIMTTIKNIFKWFKDLSPVAKILVGYVGYLLGKKVISAIKTIFGILSKTKVGTVLTVMATQFKKMATYVSTWTSAMGNRRDGLIMGIESWDKEATRAEKLQTAIGGIVTTAAGLGAVSLSMKNISEEGLTLTNTLGLVAGNVSSVFGGVMTGIAMTGSVWGGVAGGIITGISSLVTAWLSYEDAGERALKKSKEGLKEVNDITKELAKSWADTEMEITSSMAMTNYHEKLVAELESIVDENGKVKKGYEDRATFITKELAEAYGVEYKLENGVYVEVGKTNEEVKKRIQLKEQEILLEAYKEDYIEALKNENRLYADMNKRQKDRNDFYDEQNEKLAALIEAFGGEAITLEQLVEIDKKRKKGIELTREEQEMYTVAMIEGYKDIISAAENYDKQVKNSTDNYTKNKNTEMRYSNLVAAVESGDIEKVQAAADQYNHVYMDGEKEKTFTTAQEIDKRSEDRKAELENMKKNDKEAYDSFKQTLTDEQTYVKGVTPDIVNDWVALGKSSTKGFIDEFSKLDEDIQKEIIEKMYTDGYNISKKLQDGLDAFDISKQIKVDVDTANAKKIFNNLIGKTSKIFADMGMTVNAKMLASGGLPPVGQIFIANEKGPELIGNIGGQSFVANQNQVVDLIDKKIGNAQTSEPTIINLYLDANHKLGSYTLDQLQNMAKTNGKQITIG